MSSLCEPFDKKKSNISANSCNSLDCFYFEQNSNNVIAAEKNLHPNRKKRRTRSVVQKAWLAHLKSTSKREIMSNPANADTNYQKMQDLLQTKEPSYRRQSSASSFVEIEDDEEVYFVKQSYGYLAILFSLAQTIILIIMMAKCGVAPLNINPMVGPYPDTLSDWGGKNAVNILDDGEFWRLLTPILLHAGVIHLLCNIAVQLETGAFFEREWGSFNWLVIYLTSAVGSSVLSVIFMPNSVSVGSSGAVMGLFGGKLAELICRACESTKSPQAKVAASVRKEQLGGTLCAVTLVMAFSFIPFVDWAAHLGGLLAGLVVGFPIFSCSIKTLMWRILWFVVGGALFAASFGWALAYMYSGAIDPADELQDVCGYYQQFYEDYECRCLRGNQ